MLQYCFKLQCELHRSQISIVIDAHIVFELIIHIQRLLVFLFYFNFLFLLQSFQLQCQTFDAKFQNVIFPMQAMMTLLIETLLSSPFQQKLKQHNVLNTGQSRSLLINYLARKIDNFFIILKFELNFKVDLNPISESNKLHQLYNFESIKFKQLQNKVGNVD